MSNYKIVDADTLDSNLKDIADHIRTKGDTTDTLSFPQGFMDAVDAISTGGGEEVLNALIDRNITEIKANATSVGSYAFSYCRKLTSVALPACTSAGNYAFYYCASLTSVDLPVCTSAGNYVFGFCASLTSVDLPVCTSAGNYAFYSCSELTTLILRSESLCSLSNANAFTSTPIASGTGYIYVPKALIDTYKTATNWVTYANQFRALEDYTVDGTTTGALDESKI